MIEARGLTKRYGDKTAVDNLSFTVRPGAVTGFLGPNGAGKSTTIRMILGLDAPSAGSVTVNGRPYSAQAAPLREVGALLEAKAVHKGRSARDHLLALAATTGISRRRVDEVIAVTGLTEVAGKQAGGFSLGMGQRLGIAAALLGDPQTLILDEPVNGLDPEGIHWIRNLLKGLAAQGRTVFVSSHLMSEMALTAELTARSRRNVVVRTPQAVELRGVLAGPGVRVSSGVTGVLEVEGLDAEMIGRVASAHGIALFELSARTASLEEAFMELTRDDVEYKASAPANGATLDGRPSWSAPEGARDEHGYDDGRGWSGSGLQADSGAGGAFGMDQVAVVAVDLVGPGCLRGHHDRDRGAAVRAGRRARRLWEAPRP